MFKSVRVIGAPLALVFLSLWACGPSPLEEGEAYCSGVLESTWQGPVAGGPLTLGLTSFGPHAEGCHIRGSWRWNSETGAVSGTMIQLPSRNSVEVLLSPTETTCPVAEGVGEATLRGTLTEDSIFGVLGGGSRRLPESWDCGDPSDTILVFDTIQVTLIRAR